MAQAKQIQVKDNRKRVLLVDDHAEFRKVVYEFLSRLPEVAVVGEASNGKEAVSQVEQLHPDFVLIDVSMPILNGFDATEIIKKGWPATKVLITTANDSEAYRTKAKTVHADGLVLKADLKRGLEAAFGISSPKGKEKEVVPARSSQ